MYKIEIYLPKDKIFEVIDAISFFGACKVGEYENVASKFIRMKNRLSTSFVYPIFYSAKLSIERKYLPFPSYKKSLDFFESQM